MQIRIRAAALCAGLCFAVVAPAMASGPAGTDYCSIWHSLKPKRGAPTGCLTGAMGRSDADNIGNRLENVHYSFEIGFSPEHRANAGGIGDAKVGWLGVEGASSASPRRSCAMATSGATHS